MPERDDSIDANDLPSLNAKDSDELPSIDGGAADKSAADENTAKVSAAQTPDTDAHNQARAKKSSYRTNIVAISIAMFAFLLAVLSLSVAGYFYQQQSQQMVQANARIADLERQLSSTDESVSQSSVAMQVKLSELKNKTDELWVQMDKLWASAWKHNQTQISQHTEQIMQNSTAVKNAQTALAQVQKSQDAAITAVNHLKDKHSSLEKKQKTIDVLEDSLADQKKQLSRLDSELTALQLQQQVIEKTANDNAQWIQSINVFRKQTNQKINELEGLLKSPQPSAK